MKSPTPALFFWTALFAGLLALATQLNVTPLLSENIRFVAGFQIFGLGLPLWRFIGNRQFLHHIHTLLVGLLCLGLGFFHCALWILFGGLILSWITAELNKRNSNILFADLFQNSRKVFWTAQIVLMASAIGLYFYLKHSPEMQIHSATALAFLAAGFPSGFAMLSPLLRLKALKLLQSKNLNVQNPQAFERISEITAIAFDKTGTLTQGKATVSGYVAIENFSHKNLLQIAASMETEIDHPYADALLQKAKEDGVALLPIQNRRVSPGKGIGAEVQWDGKWMPMFVGNLIWMFENGVESQDVPENVRWEVEGKEHTALWISIDKKIVGSLFLEDPLRPDAKTCVQELSDEGYEVGLITGDSENVARKIAKDLKLKFSHFEVSGREKITIIKRLSEKKKKGIDFLFPKVAYIGDARNEGPALKESYLSIALGESSRMSETDSMVYLSSQQLHQLPDLFKTLNKVEFRENLGKILLIGYHLVAAAGLGLLVWKFGFSEELVSASGFAALVPMIGILIVTKAS